MNLIYFKIIIFTVFLSAFFTFIVRKLALRFNIVDRPNAERKLHQGEIPFLGGVAIFLAFFLMLYFFRDYLLQGNLEPRHWLGFFAGAGFLMIGGILDDKYSLPAKYQLIFPILASLCVVAGGVEIAKITNPFGGYFNMNDLRIPVLFFGGAWHYFVIVSDVLIVLWLMGMMYTTKLLDGVDGLVTGVTGIGGLIVFLFTISDKYYQPDIALAALVFTGACLGFLIFNWNPAKIFLGEGGSLLLGFILGVLAIISGGKIAIALLVMAIPIMDVIWIIVRRLREGKNPFKYSDRKHLHFRLQDLGLSIKQTALVYYAFAGIFGLSALFLQSRGKVIMLGVLVLIMLGMVIGFSYIDKNKNIK